jgi:transposase
VESLEREQAVSRPNSSYQIEASIRGQPPDVRQRVRAEQSKPIVEALHAWLDLQFARLAGGSRLAEAIRYALSRWTALTRFVDDDRIDLDTNPVERAIRPVTLGRKNALFAAAMAALTDGRSVASLIEAAKLNGVEPYAWLRDVPSRMVEGHPHQRLDELPPWNEPCPYG